MSRPPSGSHEDAAQAALRRVRREGRWWWIQAWHARRIWRWALLAAAAVFLLLVVLRAPLANWFWNEPQVEQLLDRGDRALAAGRLSAANGTGAREWYQAALALDSDRPQARSGLARTGQAALQQARQAVQAGDLDAAQQALNLARELQVPQRDADAVAQLLRARQHAGAGFGALLGRAEAALQAGRLDGSPDSALPLFQQALALAPTHLRALEGREDALSELLLQARAAADAGDVVRAAPLLQRARVFDAGHVDLPASEAALNSALERRLLLGQQALRAGRLESAAAHYQAVLTARPDEANAQQGVQQVSDALLAEAIRLAGDFRFPLAEQALAQARALGAAESSLKSAQQAVQQARVAQRALNTRSAPRAHRERTLLLLLERFNDAQAQGRFLTPPGNSAYDALREAQALAPQDPRVRAAAGRLLPATQDCFEDRLRENRVEAAGACLAAWRALGRDEAALATARLRLGQRWLALGSERLGRGEVAFAQGALQQAAALGVPLTAPEYQSLQQRLHDVGTLR